MKTDHTPRWASIRQTADYLEIHPSTVRRWIASGDIPAYRSGQRLLRIDLNQVDSYLARRGLPNARTARQVR